MTSLTATETYQTLVLETGNLMHTNVAGILNSAFKRSHEEVLAALRDTLDIVTKTKSITSASPANFDGTTHTLTVAHPISALNNSDDDDNTTRYANTDDKNDLDLVAKLFLFPQDETSVTLASEQVAAALQLLKKRTHLESVGSFTVAFTGFKLDDDNEEDEEVEMQSQDDHWPDMTYYHDIWKALEDEYSRGVIKALGVSEFTEKRLEKFLPVVKTPPTSNQVNLADCCVMPRALIAYCRERGIELVTHSDSVDMFSTKELKQLLKQFPSIDGHEPSADKSISVRWLLKFSVMVKSRGVLCDKGYIVFATCN